MSVSVLFTQCLQHDFVAPMGAHEPLPNELHVGRDEARRLLGVDPSRGPLAQVMHWARAQASSDKLRVVHIRDWHDDGDESQRGHLDQFGNHCIRGSKGAGLVLELDAGVQERQNEFFVNSPSLNDFEGTTLMGLLERFRAESEDGEIRAGVVGVWTEAKVSFLCYDLLTRCGIDHIATCSALTASASRAQHFNGLSQLEKILGVRVLDSVGEFVSWLDPAAPEIGLPSLGPRGMVPVLEWRGEAMPLSEDDVAILGFLYRDSTRLELVPLTGGFSGAVVLRVFSQDALGHQQAPSVVKLGPRALIADERVAFEQVEAVLGNDAPSLRGFADLKGRAGLKYAYASMGTGEVRTFKSLFMGGAPQEQIDRILRTVFDDVLGRFTRVSMYDRLPLLDYYEFSSRHADGVRERVAAIMGVAPDTEELDFGGGYRLPNLADFYSSGLDEIPQSHGESHYVSWVHGDLNGANILIDDRDNTWLIDFFHAHRGHALRDVIKVENDLQYIFTPLDDERDLQQALLVTRALRSVRDLRAPLPDSLAGVESPAVKRAWSTLRVLRGIAARLCREDRDPQQVRLGLLRYAAHTLSFDESSDLQKRWALAAASGFAQDILAGVSVGNALRVDWIDASDLGTPGRLGLTLCPGRRDRGRDLDQDLADLVASDAHHLISLITADELDWAGVPHLEASARDVGLKVTHLVIPDQGVPSLDDLLVLVQRLSTALARSENVVIHCMGGLGRSGLVAACVLMAQGSETPEKAIAAVRRARGPRALENALQEQIVTKFSSILDS